MTPPEHTPGRRATDSDFDYFEQKLLRAFEEQLKETRHEVRNELAVLATTVAEARLQATKEHAEVHGQILALRNDMAELKALPPRVTALEGADREDDAAAAATQDLRKTLWRLAGALATLVIGAAGALATFLPH